MVTAVNYEQFFVKPAREVPMSTTDTIRWDFAGANPGPDVVPTRDLAEAARQAVLEEGHRMSLYPPAQGSLPMRELIAQKMRNDRGVAWATPDDILITNGSLHGINLALELMIAPGDVIISDRYFYMGAVKRFAACGARVATVEGDADGMLMDQLEEVLKKEQAAGNAVKFIYTVPSPQNPDGSIMPVDRRKRMVELAEQYDTLIVEDDCYADEVLDIDKMPPAIAAMPGGQDRVLYLATFSKIIGPGIRLGWAAGSPDMIQRLSAYKQDGGKDYLSSIIVTKFLQDHLEDRVPELNNLLRSKRSVLVASLREHFGPNAEFTVPKAGMFLWVKFPESCDFQAMEEKALVAGVKYLSGAHFSPIGEGKHYVRFNYSFPPVGEIAEAIGVFARVARETGTLRD